MMTPFASLLTIATPAGAHNEIVNLILPTTALILGYISVVSHISTRLIKKLLS
jgi:hypothetical protein